MIQREPWDWRGVSNHPHITGEIINANPDKSWDWDGISLNPNITWDIIHTNPDKSWSWTYISKNNMILGKERWINKFRLEIIKALQRHWRNYSSNPEYKLAQKLIKKRLDNYN